MKHLTDETASKSSVNTLSKFHLFEIILQQILYLYYLLKIDWLSLVPNWSLNK